MVCLTYGIFNEKKMRFLFIIIIYLPLFNFSNNNTFNNLKMLIILRTAKRGPID